MAWRCRFLAARPSQDGRVIAEKRLSEELSGAPHALVDFHTVRDAVNRPTTDILVKGRGEIEHRVHARNVVDGPTTDVPVKARVILEHLVHVSDAGGVPRADVLVKGRRGRVVVVAR